MDINLTVVALLEFAKKFSSQASEVLIAFAAIGTLTMAILQAAKDLTPIRRWFNRWKVGSWLGQAPPIEGVQSQVIKDSATASPAALLDLLVLATASDRKALFDLEIERLAGQISAAGGIVVDYPKAHAHLLWSLARGASRDDIEELLKVAASGASVRTLLADDPGQYDSYVEAKARVTHQIQRNIDGFQISTAFSWKVWLQYASFAISGFLTWRALSLSSARFDVGAVILVAAAAGLFAPIARDLVAVLSNARKSGSL